METTQIQGKLILILGPSGTGKGTVINHLKNIFKKQIAFPASYTTRDSRPNETAGEVYHFITKKQFQKKIDKGDFLEWAIVHKDHYYGTDKHEILKHLNNGKIVLREVDIQGVQAIRELVPKENLITIFITTDNWKKLETRIKRRANISPEELLKREKSYHQEIEFQSEVDHIVYSEDGKIEECNVEVAAIIEKILNYLYV